MQTLLYSRSESRLTNRRKTRPEYSNFERETVQKTAHCIFDPISLARLCRVGKTSTEVVVWFCNPFFRSIPNNSRFCAFADKCFNWPFSARLVEISQNLTVAKILSRHSILVAYLNRALCIPIVWMEKTGEMQPPLWLSVWKCICDLSELFNVLGLAHGRL